MKINIEGSANEVISFLGFDPRRMKEPAGHFALFNREVILSRVEYRGGQTVHDDHGNRAQIAGTDHLSVEFYVIVPKVKL